MSEEDLQELIRQWYHGDASQKAERLLTPTPGCPSLPLLWRHHAQDEPLGEYAQHVAACERCHRLGDIITAKLHGPGSATRSKYIKRANPPRGRWVAGLVACAACVGLAFLLLDDLGRDDALTAQAEIFWEIAFADEPEAVRGEYKSSEAPAELPEWIAQALDDDELSQAVDDLDQLDDQLVLPLSERKIRIKRGRFVLSRDVDPLSKHGEMLHAQLRRYDSACDKIVGLLIRHLPDASQKDRADLRRALDHWRAKEVFGQNS